MTVHAFFVSHCRVKRALSAFLTFLLLLPTLTVFARPLPRTVSQARPAVSPPSAPAPRPQSVAQLRVGDIIRARSNATGKVEWKQVIHANRRTVPSLLSIHLINIKTHKPAETLVCPLDEPVRLTDGRTIPAGHLAIGRSIIPRAGPACTVTAMFLLRKPGGFLLCDVRVGPLSAAQRQRLASAQQEPVQPRPHLSARFAGYQYTDPALAYAGYAAAASSGGTVNPFLFQGQQFDPASNDYYLRARYYDPTIGRFLSQDPLAGVDADPLSLHRYLYASNDPANRTDPGGEEDANFSLGGQAVTEGVTAEEDATLSPSIAKSLAYAGARANLINARSTITLAAVAGGLFLDSAVGTKDPEQRQVLFHYTSAAAAAGILADGTIIATPQFNPSLPSGAYASDISPLDPGWTQRGLSRLFYGDNPNHDMSWYVEIDNSDQYLGGFRPLIYQGHPHFFLKDFPAGLPVPVKVLAIGPNPMSLGQ